MLRPWLHDLLTVVLLAGTQPDLESKVCDPRSVSELPSSGKLWLGRPDDLEDIAEVPGRFSSAVVVKLCFLDPEGSIVVIGSHPGKGEKTGTGLLSQPRSSVFMSHLLVFQVKKNFEESSPLFPKKKKKKV